MKLLFDGNFERPEIELSDSPAGLKNLGELLLDLNKEIELSAIPKESDFYPYNLQKIAFKINKDEQGINLIYISVAEEYLVLEGTSIALRKLGHSLLNCFNENSPDTSHIHLEYFPGNQLVAPTNCSLIIVCQR